MSENKQTEKELIEKFIGNLFAITDGIVPVEHEKNDPVHLYYERAIHKLKEYWIEQIKVETT